MFKTIVFLSLLYLSMNKIILGEDSLRKSYIPIEENFRTCRKINYIHWVFALDYSGSMTQDSPTRWSSLVKTVNDYSPLPSGYMDILDETNDRVSAFLFGSNAYSPMITHTDIGIGYQLPLPPNANVHEGTSFSNALSKAISLINSFLYEHVCFVMITDG